MSDKGGEVPTFRRAGGGKAVYQTVQLSTRFLLLMCMIQHVFSASCACDELPLSCRVACTVIDVIRSMIIPPSAL
ncbi:hypothetical protein B0J13DRAFT_557207 [Dactylonectria estremocensis]|uniref:Uncharacterized protein n=1 Tax=Dactylonectria estremocensis TaxID=1079267 RepID=A0A9P9EN40_9HYPO|nr:hypothetical protein B0J13DRAFT_557207 [Dactylonectria estremocensis]